MRLVLKILGLFAAIILGVVMLAGLQSPDFRLERSRTIPATPEQIFPWVGDITKWREWSPWMEMEPSAQIGYEGPESGVGATQTWKGEKLGSGKISFTDFEPPHRVKYVIEFHAWNTSNSGEVILTPSGEGTLVAWSMQGKNSLFARIFWNVLGLEKAMGKDFDRGLELLAQKIEKN